MTFFSQGPFTDVIGVSKLLNAPPPPPPALSDEREIWPGIDENRVFCCVVAVVVVFCILAFTSLRPRKLSQCPCLHLWDNTCTSNGKVQIAYVSLSSWAGTCCSPSFLVGGNTREGPTAWTRQEWWQKRLPSPVPLKLTKLPASHLPS